MKKRLRKKKHLGEFERSMISERTRDKIAASRRKGMWTGGPGDRSPRPLLKSAGSRFRDPA